MRDAFAVLFFVSVGILFNPRHLIESPGLVVAALAVILLGKPLAALGIVLLLKYPLRAALSVAVALAQIGEFSFVLATAGKNLGILDDRANNTLIAAAIISITLNPVLYRLIRPLESALRRCVKTPIPSDILTQHIASDEQAESGRHRAVVVGYGPVGRTLARLLRENEFEPVIIELNVDTVRALNSRGRPAIYGDAAHRDTLKQARLESAVALVLSSSSMDGDREAIRIARELNPELAIFARSSYLSEIPELRKAGADIVFSAEGEVALAMTEFLLRQLRATPEQVDRERARIRSEFFGGSEDYELSPQDRLWPANEAASQTQEREG
jgi:CPA2 family monovalent cation:H+ antiporter-2